jgi:hypothetical protein
MSRIRRTPEELVLDMEEKKIVVGKLKRRANILNIKII